MPVPRKKNKVPRTSLKKNSLYPHIRTLSIPGLARQRSSSEEPEYGRVFIGLDPSLRGFGITAVAENGAIFMRPTITTKKLKGMKRIESIIKEIRNDFLLWSHGVTTRSYKKLIVVREDYAIHANDTADTPLKELGGILEWELFKMGYPLYRLNITTIKKFATGRGNTDKDEVADVVNKRFGVCGDEDQAHAFAAAVTAMAYVNKDRIKGLDEPMKQVLKSLEGHDLTNER